MGVNISLADTLPYLEQRFFGIFGENADSTERRHCRGTSFLAVGSLVA
jgi:hypothetical protein